MIFNCTIKATFEIPDSQMREVVEQFKENWKGSHVDLFPHDLISTARHMSIGKLQYDEDDVECDEPALTESEIPEAMKRKAKRK